MKNKFTKLTNLTKKQRFILSLIILIILLFLTRTKPSESDTSASSPAAGTETVIDAEMENAR